MAKFLFCSIYMLAMTQESKIILTTCHKTTKGQMYYTDIVFRNFPDLNIRKIFNILHIKMNSIRMLSLCHDSKCQS